MDDVTFAKAFAEELEAETPATLKCLERVPPELFGWKPHERSMSMGYLATLIAEIPLWITTIITKPEIDFVNFNHLRAHSTLDIVSHFDENVAHASEMLLQIHEGALSEPFQLKRNGQVMILSTKRETLESNINHLIHHRGQLTVYLRLNNIPVPSIYGPSADEKKF
jgi:uncharacterized damage-inducible protein DinB